MIAALGLTAARTEEFIAAGLAAFEARKGMG
jgi:hypothetical protein